MTGLLLAALEIRLGPQEDWLARNVGPILLAAAAVLAAGLAAYVATRNHREQLRHDRLLRNREHLRDTIDAAFAAATEADRAVQSLMGGTLGLEDARYERRQKELQGKSSGHVALLDAAEKFLTDERIAVHRQVSTLQPIRDKLSIRLGYDHPIVVSFTVFQFTIGDYFSAALDGAKENRTQEQLASAHGLSEELTDDASEFHRACYQWFTDMEPPQSSLFTRIRQVTRRTPQVDV